MRHSQVQRNGCRILRFLFQALSDPSTRFTWTGKPKEALVVTPAAEPASYDVDSSISLTAGPQHAQKQSPNIRGDRQWMEAADKNDKRRQAGM